MAALLNVSREAVNRTRAQSWISYRLSASLMQEELKLVLWNLVKHFQFIAVHFHILGRCEVNSAATMLLSVPVEIIRGFEFAAALIHFSN